MHIREKFIPSCRAGPLAHVHLDSFNLSWVRSQQNQVLSHLGGLAHFSYEHIMFL